MKKQSKTIAAYSFVISLLAVPAGALIALMALSVSAGVVMRYLLKMPLAWLIELNEYALLFITFLGAAWVLRRGKHVNIDIIVNALSPRAQAVANMITYSFSAAACLVVMWYGGMVTWEYFKLGRFETTALELPLAYILAIIPLGSFLMFLALLEKIFSCLRNRGVE